MSAPRIISLVISALLGCAAGGPDSELPDDAQLAGASAALTPRPTQLDHGAVWFEAAVEAELSAREPVHTWSFELSAPARVTLATRGSSGPDVDTVLSLARLNAQGSARPIAHNDDAEGSVFSSLTRALEAGRYRVVVRARTRRHKGPFLLWAQCEGAGCSRPAAQRACVFGERLGDLPQRLRMSTILSLRSAEQLPPDDAAALVASTTHLPGGPVASAAALFELVDGRLVRWMRLWDDAAGRRFSAYEYGVAGESYGALFDESGQPVATVERAELVDCRVPVQSCRLGSTYRELLGNPRFEHVASATLDAEAALRLPELARSQLLHAIRVAYPEAEDLSTALAAVDSNQAHRVILREPASGLVITAYEYGAGDNSYGAVFAADREPLVARIEDGSLTACSLLE